MPRVYGEERNIKVQWAKMKDRPLKDRLEWFFHYFGLYLLIGAILIAAVISILVTSLRNRTPEILNGILFDITLGDREKQDLYDELVSRAAPKEKTELVLSTGSITGEDVEYIYNQTQTAVAMISAKTLDILGAEGETLLGFVNEDEPEESFLAPIEEMLPEDLYRELLGSGRLTTAGDSSLSFLIRVSDSRFSELLGITSEDYRIGISCTAPHEEALRAVVRLILEAPQE